MSGQDPLGALASVAGKAWLVGGALRDRLLGRATADYDVAVAGDPGPLARALSRLAGGHAFLLSEGFGGWRVIARERDWQVDLLPVVEGRIEADLAARDFTINALAVPIERLAAGGGFAATIDDTVLIDPYGGMPDLRERRLRMVSQDGFERDPLRVLRLARLKCELDFGVDEATREAAQGSAGRLQRVAPERIFGELKRIVCSDRALDGFEEMDALGATDVVLPELVALRGVSQSPYHHLDVYEHTRAVLAETIALHRDPEPVFAEHASGVEAVLGEPLADELTRGQALRLGALFHDIAKPRTREVIADGRVTFMGHDVAGAALASEVLGRLRASERLRRHVAALTEHHLALGFLVHRAPLGRRDVYRYLRACEPVEVDITVLSVADRLATRGESVGKRAIESHMALARELVGAALAWRAAPPRLPIRGDEVIQKLGIRPGPEVGRVLEELREASFAGEVHTREEALELAVRLYERGR
jgi:putative nucleotidyltransferase with HDIG domain